MTRIEALRKAAPHNLALLDIAFELAVEEKKVDVLQVIRKMTKEEAEALASCPDIEKIDVSVRRTIQSQSRIGGAIEDLPDPYDDGLLKALTDSVVHLMDRRIA